MAIRHRLPQRWVRARLERQGLDSTIGEAYVEVGLSSSDDSLGARRYSVRRRRDGVLDAPVEALVQGVDEGRAVREVNIEGSLGDPGLHDDAVDAEPSEAVLLGDRDASVEEGFARAVPGDGGRGIDCHYVKDR
jgi:hypothetical protein